MTDVEWLSLDEAAARLKISRESARRTALRKRWGKRPGNDGRVRIGVPVERLHRSDTVGQDVGPDVGRAIGSSAGAAGQDVGQAETAALEVTLQPTEPTGDARALIALLQGRVAELDTEAKAGRAALARVSVLEALLEAERARVEEWKAVADRNNLAVLLQDQGDLAGARPLHERALAISERVLGPDHPDTERSRNNLADLIKDQDEPA
jgi:hypothetical protein